MSQGLDRPIFRQLVRASPLAVITLLLMNMPAFAYDLPAQFSPVPFVGPNVMPSPVQGGLSVNAVGTETATWESNPLLLTSGAKSLYGSTTAPELIINDKTPTVKFTADTVLDENLFNQSKFNSTDIHSNAGIVDQTERWSAELNEHTDYDTTRTSELSTFNVNQPSVRHVGFSVAPQISYSPTLVDRISLGGTGQISTYDSSSFTNYHVLSLSPTYSHNFDPLNVGVFSIQAQRYQTDSGGSVTVDSITPTFGWIGTLTPRVMARANIGLQGNRQFGSGTVEQPWKITYVFSGNLSYSGQQDTTDVTFSRAEFPFSNGTEALLTGFTVAETHILNNRFSLNAGASYQTTTYQTNSPGSLDTIASANGGLIFHATEHVDLVAAYQYRHETLLNVSAEPQDHTATFSLVYRPKAWSL